MKILKVKNGLTKEYLELISNVTIPINSKLYNETITNINETINYEAKYTREVLSGEEFNDYSCMYTDFLLEAGMSYLTKLNRYGEEVRIPIVDDNLRDIASSYEFITFENGNDSYYVLVNKNYAVDIVISDYDDLKKYAYNEVKLLIDNNFAEVVDKELFLKTNLEKIGGTEIESFR